MWWGKYIGIPFVDRGRNLGGLDCWGLVREVYARERGILLPSWTEHNGFDSLKNMFATEIHRFRKLDAPEPFAIAIISTSITYLHVGVMVDTVNMLHSLAGRDSCLEPVARFRYKLKGFYVPHDQDCCPPQPP